MADIGISHDASMAPPRAGARLGLGLSGSTLQARVLHVDDWVITLRPTGTISDPIVFTLAWPIAQTLGATLQRMVMGLIDGYRFDVMTLTPSTQNVEGEQVTITPGHLTLSNFAGMLLIQGSIHIT